MSIYVYIDSYIIYIELGIVYIEILVFPDEPGSKSVPARYGLPLLAVLLWLSLWEICTLFLGGEKRLPNLWLNTAVVVEGLTGFLVVCARGRLWATILW